MASGTYEHRRAELQLYFDRTAVDAWRRLTSDAPVSGIRATVRAGRDRMRATLLSWLPADLRGRRLLDAGCGTGALAVEAARRGAAVTAIDVAGNLVDVARERCPADLGSGTIDWRTGDMTAPALGRFDHVIAMDSLIHYPADDIVAVVAEFAARCDTSLAFTFAPRTPFLTAMHAVGTLFPKSDRAPAIRPVAPARLARHLAADPSLGAWRTGRSARVASGFYTSEALEVRQR